MRLKTFVLFQSVLVPAFAQTNIEIKGKIYDKVTKAPVHQILVINKNTNKTTMTDSTGLFKISAKYNDVIYTKSISYDSDSIVVYRHDIMARRPFIFMLTPKVINLPEVTITKKVFKPYYDAPWKTPMNEVPVKSPVVVGNGGVGLSINFFYQRYSKKFIELRKAYALNDADKTHFVLRERFNQTTISFIGVNDNEFDAFVNQLKLSKDFIFNSSDYEFMVKVRKEYLKFKQDQD